MKLLKARVKTFSVSILIISFIVLSSPRSASAAGATTCPAPGCFDGFALSMTQCTCSPYYWMIFAPIFFNDTGAIPFAAAMSVPLFVTYSNFITGPAKYVGTYIKGEGACYMYAVNGCYQLPSYGTVLQFTGVSLPGSAI